MTTNCLAGQLGATDFQAESTNGWRRNCVFLYVILVGPVLLASMYRGQSIPCYACLPRVSKPYMSWMFSIVICWDWNLPNKFLIAFGKFGKKLEERKNESDKILQVLVQDFNGSILISKRHPKSLENVYMLSLHRIHAISKTKTKILQDMNDGPDWYMEGKLQCLTSKTPCWRLSKGKCFQS